MGDRAIAEAEMEIAAELVHELNADGKQLRVVKLTDCRPFFTPDLSTINSQLSTGFRGSDQLRTAVNQLQSLLYAA